LPEFARAAWSTTFLPTLYDCLGCSGDPFVINSDMVKAIQEVVDFVYPGSNYQVHAGDKLINMRRTFFGREGIKIVADFFTKDEAYANKPKAIAKYAQWAVRGNGPALFSKPMPMGCVIDKGADGYIEPEGIFQSDFIIQLLSQYLKWCKGSCHNYGRPIGALSMAATAIERGFLMYLTGTRTDQGQFSKDMVGTVIGEYVYIAGRLSNRRWNIITTLCGENREPPALMAHSVQVNRRELYEPSSPIGSDDE
ncbi:hypothetical protein BJV78DRAFT_1140472, partial [Lactifluus subvellereus]